MTNQDAAKQLRLVADFLDSEDAVETKLFASVKLTTPVKVKPGVDPYGFGHRNNVTTLTLST